MSTARKCPGCGADISLERFCSSCGSAIPQFHADFLAPSSSGGGAAPNVDVRSEPEPQPLPLPQASGSAAAAQPAEPAADAIDRPGRSAGVLCAIAVVVTGIVVAVAAAAGSSSKSVSDYEAAHRDPAGWAEPSLPPTTTTTTPRPYPQVLPKNSWSAGQLTRTRESIPGNGIAPHTGPDYVECALDHIATWYTPSDWARSATDGFFRSQVSKSIAEGCKEWGYPSVLIPSATTPTFPQVTPRNGWTNSQLRRARTVVPGMWTGPSANGNFVECALDWIVTWYGPGDWERSSQDPLFRHSAAEGATNQCEPWWAG